MKKRISSQHTSRVQAALSLTVSPSLSLCLLNAKRHRPFFLASLRDRNRAFCPKKTSRELYLPPFLSFFFFLLFIYVDCQKAETFLSYVTCCWVLFYFIVVLSCSCPNSSLFFFFSLCCCFFSLPLPRTPAGPSESVTPTAVFSFFFFFSIYVAACFLSTKSSSWPLVTFSIICFSMLTCFSGKTLFLSLYTCP